MLQNKRIKLISAAAIILIIACLVYLFFNQQKTTHTTTNNITVKTLYDEGGIPPEDSRLYTSEGWNTVPDTQGLSLAASSINGGSIILATIYKDDSSQISYLKAKIAGDYTDSTQYFKHSVVWGWESVPPNIVPTGIRYSLDKGLQIPPAEPDQLGAKE